MGEMASASFAGQARRRSIAAKDLRPTRMRSFTPTTSRLGLAELFGGDMQFDVIIGNPPYQLDDGGFRHQRRAHLSVVRRSRRKRSNRAICPWSFPLAGLLAARDWTSSASRCSPTTACARLTTISARRGVSRRGLQGRRLLLPLGPGQSRACEVSTHFKGGQSRQRTRPLLKGRRTCSSASMRAVDPEKVARPVEDGRMLIRFRCRKRSVSIELVSSRKPFGLRTTFKGEEEEDARGTDARSIRTG